MSADAGLPEPQGVLPDAAGGANVAVFSSTASAIELCLFDERDTETARIPLPARTGDVFHGRVAGVQPGTRYGLRAHGAMDPRLGHRFDAAKLLLDPFAEAVDRRFILHPSMFPGDGADSARFMPKGVVLAPCPAAPRPPIVPWSRCFIYELHVRGFSMRHPEIPPAQRGTFAALGHPAAIAHFQRLGVTTLEVMPASAWIDERHLPPLGLSNYWGYNPVTYLAPDPRLAPGGWAEIRAATDALAAAGIEVILDVVFNHSGEGDALGPTVSLRGLDNAGYYRLPEDDRAAYVNDTGCGNTLACDRPQVVRLMMDAMRCWVRRGGMAGFRFDLATTLGRRAEGFDQQAPLLTAIAQDPELRALRLVAEPWDIGPGGYRLGAFPALWGEWNDRFRDGMRRFWGDHAGTLGEFATRFAGSSDVFGGESRPPSRSINFITAHDGFTLADLVAYTAKRNQANGEGNRDGSDGNLSWNNGVEGETQDPAILAARARDQRALLACLLLARGTPMLAMGSEFGHSQAGNNNAYAQDNAAAWLDWPDSGHPDSRPDARDFIRSLWELRQAQAPLRMDRWLLEPGRDDAEAMGVVASWHGTDGLAIRAADWQATTPSLPLVVVLRGADFSALGHPAEAVAVIVNRGDFAATVTLPTLLPTVSWQLACDSSAVGQPGRDLRTPVSTPFIASARSVQILVSALDHL